MALPVLQIPPLTLLMGETMVVALYTLYLENPLSPILVYLMGWPLMATLRLLVIRMSE